MTYWPPILRPQTSDTQASSPVEKSIMPPLPRLMHGVMTREEYYHVTILLHDRADSEAKLMADRDARALVAQVEATANGFSAADAEALLQELYLDLFDEYFEEIEEKYLDELFAGATHNSGGIH